MNPSPTPTASRLEALRDLFDSGFSRPPEVVDGEVEKMLAIRVGPDPYAVRVGELAALVADPTFTRIPGAPPSLLGIVGLRGSIVAGYDLRILLGLMGGTPPRWLVLTAADRAVGLAFDDFEGHLSVPRTAIAVEEGPRRGTHTPEVLRMGDTVCPIIHIPSVTGTIKTSPRAETTIRE